MSKFDFIVGNPPYNQENRGNRTFLYNIYPEFVNSVMKMNADFSMIIPAKWMFNAGKTPKKWNQQLLTNPRLTKRYFEEKIFPITLKGGVVIIETSEAKEENTITEFIPNEYLRKIKEKVENVPNIQKRIGWAGNYYYKENGVRGERIRTNAFTKHRELFYDYPVKNTVKIYGSVKGTRTTRWIDDDKIQGPESFSEYKVFFPYANKGKLDKTPFKTIIGYPFDAATETFLSIGGFDTVDEALACEKYIQTNFVKILLSIKKVSQHSTRKTWKYVPDQDFSENSDINWSQTIEEIDQQLYKKYEFSTEEINYIKKELTTFNY